MVWSYLIVFGVVMLVITAFKVFSVLLEGEDESKPPAHPH